MQHSLQAVWHEVENLLNQNISVVPVRDRDDYHNGRTYAAKTPYKEWKLYQTQIIERGELWNQMQDRNTTAIAMVCGAVSGNLEVIDFDVKYKPGVDAVVLAAMRDLYPDIFAKLKLHRTPSGGAHLIYKIADHEVPPNTHLANRPATDDEITNTANKKKYRTFIETRGTGGLATVPPSLGYLQITNGNIQTITWEERCSIIELCRAYNEYAQEVKPYLPPKSEVNYYDENPFEHYNRTVDPVELLTEYNWTYVKRHGDYIWFTRPGGRRGDVHAGFNVNTRTYRVWGTKVDLESDRSYTPSTILAHYRFNGDKALTYAHLVQLGFGRIKPNMERVIAQRRAIQGQPMPANASPEALQVYTQRVEQLTTAHPHGIYWAIDVENDGRFTITRLGFKEVATGLGFRLYRDEIIRIVDQFLHKCDLRYFFDCMRQYIKEDDPDTYEEVYNAAQAFMERHGKFESTQLDFIDEETILHDTRSACYKFYNNGYVHITPQACTLHDYTTITDKYIWYDKIQKRNFTTRTIECDNNSLEFDGIINQRTKRGLYLEFLELACDFSANRNHIMNVIGWLAHDYKDTATGYIVTLVEKCADPKDGGGSGKNLFCQLLEHTTTVCTVAAAQKQIHDINLLQSWNGERIFVLSDPKKDFDFETLKEPSTGNATVKKLFKNEQNYKCADLPKFVVPTNFSFDISDGGLRRRIIAVEFTDFFTKCGGVDKHFGKMFPQDWSAEDWVEYDNFICECIQHWISNGLKLQPVELKGTSWEKQFVYSYGVTVHEFFKEYWEQWKQSTFVSNSDFNKQLDDFMVENNLNPKHYKPSGIKINKALLEWCKRYNWSVKFNDLKREEFRVERGRKFYEEPPF